MKKTFTLIIMMLLTSVLSINASKKYADLSKDQTHGKGTWTASTKTFTWTASSDAYVELTNLNGDLSEYTSLVLETANFTTSFRVDFVYTDSEGKEQTVKGQSGDKGSAFYSGNTKTVSLSKNLTADQLKSIKAIRINTNSSPKDGTESSSITINNAYLTKPLTSLAFINGTATLDLTDLTVTGAEYNDQTGVVTSTGTSGKISVDLPAEGLDLTDVTKLTVDHEGDDIVNTLSISNGSDKFPDFYSSKYNVNFNADNIKDRARNAITTITWNINKAGSLTIKSITFSKAETTGINKVENNTLSVNNDATYNLAGQRVGKSYKGVVIKNGRKYFQR